MNAKICSKCGGDCIDVEYLKKSDELACECLDCGYEWREKPIPRTPEVVKDTLDWMKIEDAIKENLRAEVEAFTGRGNYSSVVTVGVKLLWKGEEISSCYDTVSVGND